MATDKINKVATLAEFRERNSAGVFKQSRQAHEQQRQQFDQLIQFKQEYEARLGQVGEQGIPARQLQDYRLFLSKLNQAIEQQRAAVSDSAQQLEGDREQWMTEATRQRWTSWWISGTAKPCAIRSGLNSVMPMRKVSPGNLWSTPQGRLALILLYMRSTR